MSPQPAPQGAIEVVLVESDGCHLCADAADVIAAAASEHDLHLRRVALTSEEGRSIMRAERAPMPPVVLLDGRLLGWGRLSRGKLRRRLDQLESERAS